MPVEAGTRHLPQAYHAAFQAVVAITPQQFFDHQVETLVALRVGKYSQADPFRGGRLPPDYSLWIPRVIRPEEFDDLLHLVRRNAVAGVNRLTARYHFDLDAQPGRPHLCVGIRDGRGRLNVTPIAAAAAVAREGRKPYVTGNGILHTISFPEVLDDHFMDFGGSRYAEEYRVPFLYVNAGGNPALDSSRDGDGDARPKWGTPCFKEWLVP